MGKKLMYFVNNSEFTKNGFYEVGDFKTFSKFEAWEKSNKDLSKIKFNFNDDLFSTNVDFKTEPKLDINELYKNRAQDLRDKYDYLVLMYSGGIDSNVVLKTFVDNNIKLDEICTFTTLSIEGPTGLMNREVVSTAIPNAIKTEINFRQVDLCQLMISQYRDDFHFKNHHYYANGADNNWSIAVRSHKLKEYITDHMDIARSKTVCYIWGFDKPSMLLNDGHHALTFIDQSIDFTANQFVNRVLLKDKFGNFYDEAFYISSDAPDIQIKQGHLLLNMIHSIDKIDNRLLGQDELNNTGPVVIHHHGQYYRFLTKQMVDSCIYPNEDITKYTNDKVKGSMTLTPRDSWFNQGSYPETLLWKQNLDKIVNENKNFYRFKDGLLLSRQPLHSKTYRLT